MKPKKIAIIGTVGVPACYGGFETLAEHLVKELGEEHRFYVYCTKKKYPQHTRRKTYEGARLFYLPFDANGISSIVYDCVSILHALFYADVLLILGVPGGILFPLVRLFTRKKMIISIDGIEWKRDKWPRPARWYLWWAEKMAVKYAHADIADNESIQDYTAYRYKTLSNIIEYGADHTLRVKPATADYRQYPFLQGDYAFKVCRIEPENNLHIMLRAFDLARTMPLVVVGNWQHNEYGRQLRQQYAGHAHILLLDPIYDQGRLDLLRGNATLYIHGHSAGGTNPSLVEAMYLGLPVMAYNVSYNRTTTENKAWYFSEAEELAGLLRTVTPAGLRVAAAGMSAIARRRYTWKVIARKYAQLISEVVTIEKKIAVIPAVTNVELQELLSMEAAHLACPDLFYEKR